MTTLGFRALSDGWLETIQISLRDRKGLLSQGLLGSAQLVVSPISMSQLRWDAVSLGPEAVPGLP